MHDPEKKIIHRKVRKKNYSLKEPEKNIHQPKKKSRKGNNFKLIRLSDWEKITLAVREAGASRHNGGSIRGPP